MKRISMVALVVFPILMITGCFIPMIHFDPPPYELVETNTLPARVERTVKREHPDKLIKQVESLTWPPTGKKHYRVTFEIDGENMQIDYNHRGKELRPLRAASAYDDNQSERADFADPPSE